MLEHGIETDDGNKTIDEATTRELEEYKRQLKKRDEQNAQLQSQVEQAQRSEQLAIEQLESEQNKPTETKVEYKEVIPDKVKRQLEQIENNKKLLQQKENGEIAISGRELHKALEVKTPYKKWFERMSEYGFEENVDFTVMDIFVHNPLGGRQNQTDHALTLDTAKEIAMIQRSEPGKRARQYFIQVEKVHDQKRARTYEQINRICKEEIRNHVNNKNKLTSQISTLVQNPNFGAADFFVESSYLEFLGQSVILRSDDF